MATRSDAPVCGVRPKDAAVTRDGATALARDGAPPPAGGASAQTAAGAAPGSVDPPPSSDAPRSTAPLEQTVRKYAWAQRGLARLGLSADEEACVGATVSVEPAADLTDNDRSFLRWLARAAIRLYLSEEENGGQ